ncbi:hypothetical protein [Catellatospora methionotrophica]|uniref:hypothetical protein n=1 Tax=Catellatospora methionotrophica TaxID=121620 RepID=UPI0033D0495E
MDDTSTGIRPIREIADDIRRHWTKPHYAAVPYLKAMGHLDRITDMFMADDARGIVRYFLSNAGTWRGDDARRIKAKLQNLLS